MIVVLAGAAVAGCRTGGRVGRWQSDALERKGSGYQLRSMLGVGKRCWHKQPYPWIRTAERGRRTEDAGGDLLSAGVAELVLRCAVSGAPVRLKLEVPGRAEKTGEHRR